MSVAAASAVLLAATLDRVVGEPPARFHPVVWLGKPVGYVDSAFSDSRVAGVAAAIALPLGFAGVAFGIVLLGLQAGPPSRLGLAAGTILAALVLFVCSSLRMLVDVADDAIVISAEDLEAGREALIALAGRDASDLSAGQVRSAAVESAAENLADGFVAPVAAFAVGAVVASLVSVAVPSLPGAAGWSLPAAAGAGGRSLPAAAGAAAWVKGVNTLDSMLGYRSKPVGWAPARLDDTVMWVPARLTVVLLAGAALAPYALLSARRWARVPRSPNSGWPMATIAAVVDVRLEKPGAYTLNETGSLPATETAGRALRVVDRAGWLAVVLAGIFIVLVGEGFAGMSAGMSPGMIAGVSAAV